MNTMIYNEIQCHLRGGMVDVEFIIQFLQLLHGADHPEVLERNSGEALAALVAKDLVHPDHAAILLQAIELLSALTQVLRLCLDDSFDRDTAPDGLKTLLAQAVGEPEFERVDARLNDVLSRVKSAFDEIIC